MYPAFFNNQDDSGQKAMVEFADIGCGYGGLLGNCGYNINNTNKPKYSLNSFKTNNYILYIVSLATEYPQTLMLGLEIRVKVSKYI